MLETARGPGVRKTTKWLPQTSPFLASQGWLKAPS
ncbi:rCG21901 [Rattus norvegicus]|uniref:RCG21901 n=1 Tax=Rattus norvegicus TaxID=10116 RepID=A6J231_RAT|nr:rCG21901 [Rattus norvegicus]